MVEEILEWTAIAIDAVGIGVMLIGFVLAMARFLPTIPKAASEESLRTIQMIRCQLGTYLVFALELMIVSDLVHSVLSRALEDLYFLAALVAIRTVIAYFLNKELQELHGTAKA